MKNFLPARIQLVTILPSNNTNELTAFRDRLTQNEVELIQKTWSIVGDSIELGIDFYNRLFYLHPVIRPIFKENIRQQARIFNAQITSQIGKLAGRYDYRSMIENADRQSNTHEAWPQHHRYVQEALLHALKHHLRQEWNDNVELAWIKLYKIIANRMMLASQQ